jgi:hypothetical protein
VNVEVELYGGMKDGTLLALPDGPMPHVLRLPVVPSLAEILGLHYTNRPVISQALTYEWDGTVRDDGVRRFRLAGMPRPVWD